MEFDVSYLVEIRYYSNVCKTQTLTNKDQEFGPQQKTTKNIDSFSKYKYRYMFWIHYSQVIYPPSISFTTQIGATFLLQS